MRMAWLPGSRPAQFPQPSQNNYSRSPAHLANHPGWLSASCTFPLTSQVCYLPLLKDSRLLLHGRQAGIRVCWICNSVHEPKHAAGQRLAPMPTAGQPHQLHPTASSSPVATTPPSLYMQNSAYGHRKPKLTFGASNLSLCS